MLVPLAAAAAESANGNQILILLTAIGPLIGAVAVVWTQILAHRKEREAEENRYWRTVRHEAYADLVAALTDAMNGLMKTGDVSADVEAHLNYASHQAALIARPDLYRVIQDTVQALDAMQPQQGKPEPIPKGDDRWYPVLVLNTAMRDEIRKEIVVPGDPLVNPASN